MAMVKFMSKGYVQRSVSMLGLWVTVSDRGRFQSQGKCYCLAL